MPATPPLNGTLIRRTPGADTGAGLNDAKEWYYDPAARTADVYVIFGSSDFSSFQLDPAVIIDRYCLAPGLAPYTERQVSHLGVTGNVKFTDVDGVTSCQISCTLTLALTPPVLSNGRGDLTATASGATGPVLFSLDGFDTPGVPGTAGPGTAVTHTFLSLPPGTYTVEVRQTGPGNCAATATATLTATYGVRYELHFMDITGAAGLLQIFERDYSGPVTELEGQPDPVVLDWPGGATDHVFTTLLRGSECRLSLLATALDEFRPLFSGDERLHRVEYRQAGALRWVGFLLPEQYDAEFLSPPSPFGLSATDGLGLLSARPFAGPAGQRLRGDWTVLAVVQYCLAKLNTDLPLRTRLNLYPAPATLGATALEQVRIDVGQLVDEKGKPLDCGRVLGELLKSFQASLYQWDGAWWLERLIELGTGPLAYAAFDGAGVRGADLSLSRLHTVSASTAGPLFWLDGAQRQLARGAVATVTANADPGALANLLGRALPTNADLPAALPGAWTSNTNTPGTAFSQLLYQGKDKPPLLRLLGTAGPYTTRAARDAAALVAAWVQTPLTPPLPLPFGKGGPHANESLVLRFTATPYGNTPDADPARLSALYFGLHYGGTWLQFNYTSLNNERADPALLTGIELGDSKSFTVAFPQFFSAQVGAQPVFLRLYAPVGGASPATVDITDLRLEYSGGDTSQAAFTSTYTGDTGQLVSRTDVDSTLLHLDTPHARYAGTLLDGAGLPTQGWYEPATPGQVRELGDWFVAARLVWQRRAAQVLTGTLRGPVNGPGALLTDPSEATPAVYKLTGFTLSAATATATLTACQLLPLDAPTAGRSGYGIANEDGTRWQDEAGNPLIYEYV